nr:MAG TPA: Nuclease [Caudoviricetes sp.]
MLEKDIEKFLVREVKKLGGLCYKWVSPGNAGVPDRIVLLPNRPAMFVELKTDKGKLSRLQEVQIKKLRNINDQVYVLCGLEEIKEFIKWNSNRTDTNSTA